MFRLRCISKLANLKVGVVYYVYLYIVVAVSGFASVSYLSFLKNAFVFSLEKALFVVYCTLLSLKWCSVCSFLWFLSLEKKTVKCGAKQTLVCCFLHTVVCVADKQTLYIFVLVLVLLLVPKRTLLRITRSSLTSRFSSIFYNTNSKVALQHKFVFSRRDIYLPLVFLLFIIL